MARKQSGLDVLFSTGSAPVDSMSVSVRFFHLRNSQIPNVPVSGHPVELVQSFQDADIVGAYVYELDRFGHGGKL